MDNLSAPDGIFYQIRTVGVRVHEQYKEPMMAIEKFDLATQGFVFWPVGSGDSTTVIIDAETVMQIDLRQLSASEDSSDTRWPVVDHLVESLPKKSGVPYLAAFVLTHPDEDHCQGFAELLDQVLIGELWFSPKVLDEADSDLSDDAKAFKKEAKRRIDLTIAGVVNSGDRVRIIGAAALLDEAPYDQLPASVCFLPGDELTTIDDVDKSESFHAVVLAPFKEDFDGERNSSSVGLRITLIRGDSSCSALLLGDLAHASVSRVFEESDDNHLTWNIFQAPHHCSRTVMYVEEDDRERLDRDLLNSISAKGEGCKIIVSSSEPIPSSNDSGDNPPHAQAKNRYLELVEDDHFLVTGEFPSEENTEPIVFRVTDDGCSLSGDNQSSDTTDIAAALALSRGGINPPDSPVRFGS